MDCPSEELFVGLHRSRHLFNRYTVATFDVQRSAIAKGMAFAVVRPGFCSLPAVLRSNPIHHQVMRSGNQHPMDSNCVRSPADSSTYPGAFGAEETVTGNATNDNLMLVAGS